MRTVEQVDKDIATLRESLAEHYKERSDETLPPERVIEIQSTINSLEAQLAKLLDERDSIIHGDPGDAGLSPR